jgi:sentrin-specific protease 1
VFIPINICELHWYLVVLNAKRREIQILDSLGSSLGHKDLDCVVSK